MMYSKTPIETLISMIDEHISKHKDYSNKFDTGAMISKNFAKQLLGYEKKYMERITKKTINEQHSI